MLERENNISWPGWETVRIIGRGSFGAVYEIQREVFGEIEKAALKHISIPQNDSDIEELYSDGYDDESITSTFQSYLKSIVAEYTLMRKMNGSPNIVNCEDIRYVQHDNGMGWDIFIKMELLTPLVKTLSADISDATVIKLGMDICAALELCATHNIIHRDIKPQNIFLSPYGDYKLGDFGIAKTVEKTMGGTKIGTYKYMAPEVYNNQPYGSSADIYSQGLVLYWMLNERRMPFMPLPPEKPSAGMEEDCRARRLSGEALPPPAHGSEELKRIVLKACAYEPSERYHSAAEFREDLEILKNSVSTFHNLGMSAKSSENLTDKRAVDTFAEVQNDKQIHEASTINPERTVTAESQFASPIKKTGVKCCKNNKKKKRSTIAIAVLFVMLVSLGIAGEKFGVIDIFQDKQAGQTTVNDDGDAMDLQETCDPVVSNKVTIDVIAAGYGQNTAAWWKQFEADFEAANENIDLVVDVVSWNDIYTKVNTRIGNDDAPDILNIDVFADYQAEGLLLPAQDYISAETYAKFYESFLEQSVVDGTVWAVPDLASARAMYYNKDILDAAGVAVPTTWDELIAACEAIKAYDDSIYPWGVDMTTDEGQACFAYYIWNNGGNFTDAEGNWTLNDPKNVEAVEFIVGMVKDGLTNTDPAQETRYVNQDMFGAGKVAMMIGPNSIPTYIADGGYSINWGVAGIPTNTGVSISQGVMDRFMCFDNDYTKEELEAIKVFFDFFYEDTRYSDWVLMEGFLPATSAGGEIMAAADPANAAWIEIVGSSYFYPTAKAEWADVKQGVINVLQQALLGGDARQLLDQLQSDITDASLDYTQILPTKGDYASCAEWDGISKPAHSNGSWSQSYAVIDSLAKEAGQYENTIPEFTFTLACHEKEDSPIGEFLNAWADAVTIATEGKVDFDIGYSAVFSSIGTVVDDLSSGKIDFAWVSPGYYSDRFPLTNVIQNASLAIQNNSHGSRVLWELYNDSESIQAEYKNTNVLFMCTGYSAPLSYKGSHKITSISEIYGNIYAKDGPRRLWATEVCGAGTSSPLPEMYEYIRIGIYQYSIINWLDIDNFLLFEPGVLNYYLDYNFGNSANVLLVNENTWELCKRTGYADTIWSVSGDYLLELVDIWDYWEAAARYKVVQNGGIIFPPSPEFKSELDAISQVVAQQWITETGEGAQEVYDKALELVEKSAIIIVK